MNQFKKRHPGMSLFVMLFFVFTALAQVPLPEQPHQALPVIR